MIEKTKGPVKNGQHRHTGNIVHKTQNEEKRNLTIEQHGYHQKKALVSLLSYISILYVAVIHL